ncbi:hypothetical protein N431DRAFT_487799 [Stipitochalara longipes BDJ]|nr:hypothetical protein N431DRAFT_487799 [Stipitochalara longipes BDJ]
MDLIIIHHQLFWFILSTLFFFYAMHQPIDHFRRVLSILQILSIAICFGGDALGLGLLPYPRVWVPIVLGLTLHTTSTLMVEKRALKSEATSSIQLWTTFRIWTNFRGLPTKNHSQSSTPNESVNRIAFSIVRSTRILAIYTANRLITHTISTVLLGLNLELEDFAPTKQSLLPSLNHQDLCLRAIMSAQWIWSSYSTLTSAHDFLAILFVSVLRWDVPTQWPTLFGSIVEAYSLRRFWGVFWHRLHVKPFEAYLPSFFFYGEEQNIERLGQEHGCVIPRKMIRALWIFLLSAICHAVVNWVTMRRSNIRQETQFFLSNYIICVGETAAARSFTPKPFLDGGVLMRFVGYTWVFGVFFCLVPAWQYSLIYPAALVS